MYSYINKLMLALTPVCVLRYRDLAKSLSFQHTLVYFYIYVRIYKLFTRNYVF